MRTTPVDRRHRTSLAYQDRIDIEPDPVVHTLRFRDDGILATDEDEARRFVLAWQGRCSALEAEIEAIELREEGYTDHPGVVWQGLRAPVE